MCVLCVCCVCVCACAQHIQYFMVSLTGIDGPPNRHQKNLRKQEQVSRAARAGCCERQRGERERARGESERATETVAREAGKLRPKSCGRSNNAAFEINMGKKRSQKATKCSPVEIGLNSAMASREHPIRRAGRQAGRPARSRYPKKG